MFPDYMAPIVRAPDGARTLRNRAATPPTQIDMSQAIIGAGEAGFSGGAN